MKYLTLIFVAILSDCSATIDVNKPLPPIPPSGQQSAYATQTPPEAPSTSWKFWQRAQNKGSKNFSPKKAVSNMYYKTANAAVRTQVYTAAAFGHDHDQYGALGRAEQRHTDLRAKTNVKLIGIQNAKENGYAMNDKYWNTYDKMFKPNNGPAGGTPRPLTHQVPSVPTGSQLVSGEARRKPVGPRDPVYAPNSGVAQRRTGTGSYKVDFEPPSQLDLDFSEGFDGTESDDKSSFVTARSKLSRMSSVDSAGSFHSTTETIRPQVPPLNLDFLKMESGEKSPNSSAGPSPVRRDTTVRQNVDSPNGIIKSDASSNNSDNESTLTVDDPNEHRSVFSRTNSQSSGQSFDEWPGAKNTVRMGEVKSNSGFSYSDLPQSFKADIQGEPQSGVQPTVPGQTPKSSSQQNPTLINGVNVFYS